MTVNTLGSHEQDRSSRTVAEWLWPFLPMGISAFSLSALIWYHLRRDRFETEIHSVLQQLYAGIYKVVGLAPSVLFFLLALTWSSIWFATGTIDRPLGRLGRLLAMMVMLGVFLNLGDGGVSPAIHKGELGAWLAEHLVSVFGYLPSLLLVLAITFASLLLATDFFFSESFERLRAVHATADADEAGVEVAVTEHLRSLAVPTVPPALPKVEGVSSAAPLAAAAAAMASAATAEPPASSAVAPVAADAADAADAGGEVAPAEPAEPEPRRRSYFERRRERELRWQQEEWVPPAIESQEIENAEAALRGEELPELAGDRPSAVESMPTVEPAEPMSSSPVAQFVDSERGGDGGAVVEVAPGEQRDAVEADDAEVDDDGDDEVVEIDDLEDIGAIDEERSSELEPVASVTRLAPSAVDDDEDDEEVVEEEVADGGELEDDEPAAERAVAFAEDRGRDRGDLEIAPATAAMAADDVFRIPLPPATEVPAAADEVEQVVSIPRPEAPVEFRAPEPPVVRRDVEQEFRDERAERRDRRDEAAGEPERAAGRQQQLFGSWLDEGLIQDAIEVVTSSRRANAALLQRKLRIDYALAKDVLAALAARGVVELEGDETQGRVLG
jgi:ribosomal protein S25